MFFMSKADFQQNYYTDNLELSNYTDGYFR